MKFLIRWGMVYPKLQILIYNSLISLLISLFSFQYLRATKNVGRWSAAWYMYFNFSFVDLRKICLLREKSGDWSLPDATCLRVMSNFAPKNCVPLSRFRCLCNNNSLLSMNYSLHRSTLKQCWAHLCEYGACHTDKI